MMEATEIVEGMHVDAPHSFNGVCTGRVSSDRAFPNAPRAEVMWPGGEVRWPLVRILTPAKQ
jgi:hypothetical protein